MIKKLNILVHAGIAIGGGISLFTIPFHNGMVRCTNLFSYIYGLGVIFILGIGDGNPPPDSKWFGSVVLALLVLLSLSLVLLNVSLLIRTWKSKHKFAFIGVLCVWALCYPLYWVLNADQMAQDAILNGDFRAYERAARWRIDGNINDDLYCAARWGQLEMVKHLIAAGADPNWKLGGNGDSILSGAIPNVMNKPGSNDLVVGYLRAHGATN